MKIFILIIRGIIFVIFLPICLPIVILVSLILIALGAKETIVPMLEPLKFWEWDKYPH